MIWMVVEWMRGDELAGTTTQLIPIQYIIASAWRLGWER